MVSVTASVLPILDSGYVITRSLHHLESFSFVAHTASFLFLIIKDHPIVLASEGFTAVTGYTRSQIIGRNCRFLQGPGTAPESIQRIRDGLNSGEGCNELLLNYRKPSFLLTGRN